MYIVDYQTPTTYTDGTKDLIKEMVERYPNKAQVIVEAVPQIDKIMRKVNLYLRLVANEP